MSSPFPGMNPFIENSAHWHNFHNRMIIHMETAINSVLPPGYVAESEQWLSVLASDYKFGPDVYLRENVSANTPIPEERGSVATLARPTLTADEPVLISVSEEVPRQLYLNIVRANDQSSIVTTIEILSPANKNVSNDYAAYRRKQRQVCESQTHLVEIDLLRGGAHTVAVPIETLTDRTWDYIVCLHRGSTGPEYEIWPCKLRERLPRILIPLADEDPDIVLDLQALFDECYDKGYYSHKVHYDVLPSPPLKPGDAAWADALLREKGLRIGVAGAK